MWQAFVAMYVFLFVWFFFYSASLCHLTGHSGEGGQRRNPQGNVLAPVLGPGAEKIHHPGLLEQLVQRLQPGQLPQAEDAAQQPAIQYVTVTDRAVYSRTFVSSTNPP